MSKLTSLQRLAIGQYLSKKLNTQLKRGAGGLRDEVDAALLAAYETDGTDRRAVLFDGQTVGHIRLQLVEATERQTEERLEVQDAEAFSAWAASNPDTVAAWLSDDAQAAEALAGWALLCAGEQPAGTGWREVVTQYETPAGYKTVLTVNAKELEAALPELRRGVFGELGGGK